MISNRGSCGEEVEGDEDEVVSSRSSGMVRVALRALSVDANSAAGVIPSVSNAAILAKEEEGRRSWITSMSAAATAAVRRVGSSDEEGGGVHSSVMVCVKSDDVV